MFSRNIFKIKAVILITLSGLWLSGCEQSLEPLAENGRFYFSYDGVGSLRFKIDQTVYTLHNQQTGSVKLAVGLHTLTLSNGEDIRFMVYPGNQGGIINPAKQTYYAYSYFQKLDNQRTRYRLPINSLKVNDYLVSGLIESSNALFIDNSLFKCHSPIGEKVSEIELGTTTVNDLKTKCLTHPELLDLLNNNDTLLSQLQITRDSSQTLNTITSAFDYRLSPPNFTDSGLQKQALSIIEIIKNFRQSPDAMQKTHYYDDYHGYISDMARIYSLLPDKKQNIDDKQRYADFMDQTGAIFGAGVLVMQ